MNKETSSRVSSIAGEILNVEPIDRDASKNEFNILLEKAQTLAGSALSQDKTPGQETAAGDFFTRLKDEREDLDRRLTALNSYLNSPIGHKETVTPWHRKMLEEQSRLMSDLLAVLDERIADIEISRRSSTENDNAE